MTKLSLYILLIAVLIKSHVNQQVNQPSPRLGLLSKTHPITEREHKLPLLSTLARLHKGSLIRRKSSTTAITLLILALSGDIESNPGPSSIYPCGYCELQVNWSAQALACDECSIWFHRSCLDMCTTDYKRLEAEGSGGAWICNRCGTPNYDNHLFHSYELETSNNFSILGSFNSHLSSPGSTFIPTHASSPIPHGHRTASIQSHSLTDKSSYTSDAQVLPAKGNNWRSMIVNVNGSRGKATVLSTVIDYVKPDVIIGCESKLTDKVYNTEVFPPGYQKDVLRKDRTDHGGGVFLAFKDGYVVSQIENSYSNSDSIWAEVAVPNQPAMYICSFYRPPGSGAEPINELNKAITQINPRGVHDF